MDLMTAYEERGHSCDWRGLRSNHMPTRRKPHALLSQKTQEEENEVEIKENKGNE